MNKQLLNIDVQEFINDNLNSDITKLLLKGTTFKSIETIEIIEQIEAKNKCKTKLPTWFNSKQIYYPNKLNIEQTSSEITAKYKSNLIDGDSIIDMTGGFGVDCFYFSKRFKNVTHCEINEELSAIVSYNYKQLYIENIKCHSVDGVEFLKQTQQKFDWIYIDPSRRHDSKGKVFFLKDCLPDVPAHFDVLFKHSKNIMIKTSPLLDISIGISELTFVKAVHIVAINNEVKELLWILQKEYTLGVSIETVNIKGEHYERFSFKINDENDNNINYSEPLNYLYEPNSAILKSGGFSSVAKQLHLFKLHKHSHLYTYDVKIDFPGRCFEIKSTHPYSKKLLKNLKISQANITTRNFPETVEQIRKKFSIKDGGSDYLFFTTNLNDEKIVLVCSKTN